MKTAGIVVDNYKVNTFKEQLTAAGYKFTEHSSPIGGEITTIKVEFEDIQFSELSDLIKKINTYFQAQRN